VNSNSSGSTSIYASETIIPDTPGEDSDTNRPATPLCDENAETFPDEDEPPQSKPMVPPGRSVPPYKSSEQPLSFPLPEFAHHRSSSNDSLRQLKSYPKPKSPTVPTREESSIASPVAESHSPMPAVGASPIPPTSPPSVMPSSAAANEKDPSSVPTADEKSLSSSFSSPPPAKSTNVTDNTNGGRAPSAPVPEVVSESAPVVDSNLPHTGTSPPLLPEKEINSEDGKDKACLLKLGKEEEKLSTVEDDVLVSPPSSDCDGSPSGEEDLAQRVQNLYQRFDEWDSGNRSVARSLSYASSNNTEDGTEFNRLSLHLDKPWLSRSKAIDLDELRQQPSDITKSLIAKKSIFDEDSKRLESLNDTSISNSSLSNWRLSFAARSTSTASNSSTTSVPLTPTSASSTASSNVFPPPTPTRPATPHTNHPLSPSTTAQDIRAGTGKPAPSSIPVKIPTTSSSSVTTAGPLPNSIIKRKEGIPGDSETLQWRPKDPRLGLKSHQNHTPSKIPISASTSSNSPSPAHRPAYINPNLHSGKHEPLKSSIELPKGKNSGEQPSDESQKPTLMTQKSAPPPGIHQGIPRMVERSMSLDSKKPVALSPPADPLPTPSLPSANPCNSIPATGSTSSSLASRRISADNCSSKEGQGSISHQRKEGDPTRPKNRGVESNKLKEVRAKPSITIVSSVTVNAIDSSKIVPKLDATQEESNLNIQQPNGTVTTLQQTPPISSKPASSSSTSGKEKESNKKEKDPIKKNSKSGSGIGSSNPNSVTNNSSTTKGDSSGSNKSKEKSGSGSGDATEKSKHENSRHGTHHHKEKKKKDGSAKEKANENTTAVLPSTSSIPHEPKKEKDSKSKRHHSTTESQPGEFNSDLAFFISHILGYKVLNN